MFGGGTIGRIDATFPFAYGLAAHPQFLGELGLGQIQMFAERFDRSVVPDHRTVLFLNLVLGLKAAEGNGLVAEVDRSRMVARLNSGTSLDGTRTIAVAPPSPFCPRIGRKFTIDQGCNLIDAQGHLQSIASLKLLEESIILAAGFHGVRADERRESGCSIIFTERFAIA
jgi:hypothetical protein